MALGPKKNLDQQPKTPIQQKEPQITIEDSISRAAAERLDANLFFNIQIAHLGFVIDEHRKREAMKTGFDMHTFFRCTLPLVAHLRDFLVSLDPHQGKYVVELHAIGKDGKVASHWQSDSPLDKKEVLIKIKELRDLVITK